MIGYDRISDSTNQNAGITQHIHVHQAW